MAVTTYSGRARRALLHKTNSTYFVGIGRTTAWDDEDNPPDPLPTASTIEEPVVYVTPTQVTLCKVVSSGEDVTHLGTKYEFVADVDAIDEGARFLYMLARFDPTSGQPYDTFRQVALFSNLTPASGHESDSWLAPANVDDEGLLEYLDNDVATIMTDTRLEVIEIMIEFR
jgi:hypothetical protein